MAGLQVKAIVPKTPAKWSDSRRAEANMYTALNDMVIEIQRQMSKYPPWRPWKNPPKTGLRAGGKRTGSYGKGWKLSGRQRLKIGGNPAIISVNDVAYASYVGGSSPGQQAAALAARGWPSITTIAKSVERTFGAKVKLT